MTIRALPLPSETLLLPPEIGFLVAHGISPHILRRAAELAQLGGTDAATALLHAGLLDENTFYRALARTLRTPFLDTLCLDETTRYPQVLDVGAAALAPGSPHQVVAAPRGRSVARLIERSRGRSPVPAITTPTRLREAAFARHAREIATAASDDLAQRHPEWSCRPGPRVFHLASIGATIGLLLVLAHLPFDASLVLLAAIQIAVLAMLTVRIASLAVASPTEFPVTERRLRDDQLPTYTVLVALYREAKVVPRLIHGLGSLDYPAAKLQVMFLIEEDDEDTAAAFRAAPMPARFEVVVVPPGLPRTKPRALNVALPLARGECLVVYDAEDVVDRKQLRIAASLCSLAGETTACLQGRLVIDNVADGLLTRLFAIEYSALFDVLGPALALWGMPTPLGGTTTHFRTRVLRSVGGWDSWNVTEDADLGMRLAFQGYRVGDLPSATHEEAPTQMRAWLRQRTRWMKGFLQTSFTHGRRPLKTFRRLGAAETLCALTLLPGTVVSALLYPLLMLPACYRLVAGGPEWEAGLLSYLTQGGAIVVFGGGIAAMLLPGALGCVRRERRDLLPYVLLLPAYFLLVSAAAWLAVFELIRHPYRWNKTEHGLSRTSRSGALHLRRGQQRITPTSPGLRRPPSAAA